MPKRPPTPPLCASCPQPLAPSEIYLALAVCFACRVLERSAYGINRKHRRAVTDAEQHRHTMAVKDWRHEA